MENRNIEVSFSNASFEMSDAAREELEKFLDDTEIQVLYDGNPVGRRRTLREYNQQTTDDCAAKENEQLVKTFEKIDKHLSAGDSLIANVSEAVTKQNKTEISKILKQLQKHTSEGEQHVDSLREILLSGNDNYHNIVVKQLNDVLSLNRSFDGLEISLMRFFLSAI